MIKKSTFSLFKNLLLIGILFISQSVLADGSKELYPAGAPGYRAKLRAYNVANNAYPYANNGFHYVYAKVGERITMASSGQGINNRFGRLDARIKLFNPLGVEVINNNTTGVIANRTAELAGPALPSGAVGNQYTPVYHQVTVTGIYRVEFTAPDTLETLAYVNANDNFIQGNNVNVLFAWDVSVVNTAGTGFISGRVYANVMTMSTGGNVNNPGYPLNAPAFYGVFYSLTKDGYTYRVKNNGNQGFGFTFFVNNNGVLDSVTQQPIYKSLAGIDRNTNASKIHDPNTADTSTQITHKLFYTLPANDLPTGITNGAVPGGNTWLKTTRALPSPSAFSIEGVEGTSGQLSSKGGYIKFTSPIQANYRINITDSPSNPFPTRVLAGTAEAGTNTVYFDGKDGIGQPLPIGTVNSTVQIQLQGAEVHFPYIDMEYNTQGIIIERLDGPNLSTVASDRVYWNDIDIPDAINPAVGGAFRNRSDPKVNTHLGSTTNPGISSNSNGHIWGQGATGVANQFGDNNVMDTWTFVEGPVISQLLTFEVAQADLKISALSADKDMVLPGDQVIFTMKVKNDGPDDVTNAPFAFYLPIGYSASTFTFTGNSCGVAGPINFDAVTRKLTSNLDLPNGCEVTIAVPVIIGTPTQGLHNFSATILRTNDVTDPDATNPDPNIPPTDPFFECANNGLLVPCNNLRSLKLFYSPEEVCTEQVLGENFTASDGTPKTFNQPATNYGFVFDIFTLDNSFNLTINGVQLASSEIEFQSAGTPAPGINIRFVDGDQYEANTGDIWSMTGTAAAPLIRVVISPTGTVTLFGSKVSGGPLFPLELFNGNSLNTILWNTTAPNVITVTQNVVGDTNIAGRGYGLDIVPCVCFNPATSVANPPETKMGITSLQRAGADSAGNWPMVRKSGHLALESNTKGFVVTRIATIDLPGITSPQEGMMVYDTTEKCLKIFSDGIWSCFSTPTCP